MATYISSHRQYNWVLVGSAGDTSSWVNPLDTESGKEDAKRLESSKGGMISVKKQQDKSSHRIAKKKKGVYRKNKGKTTLGLGLAKTIAPLGPKGFTKEGKEDEISLQDVVTLSDLDFHFF